MFLIRENAIRILAEGYKNCDGDFKCENIDWKKILGDNASDENVSKCRQYLIKKDYIIFELINPSSFNLTIAGIDTAEDYIKQQG